MLGKAFKEYIEVPISDEISVIFVFRTNQIKVCKKGTPVKTIEVKKNYLMRDFADFISNEVESLEKGSKQKSS